MFKRLFGGRNQAPVGTPPRPPVATSFADLKEQAFHYTEALMAGHQSWGIGTAAHWDVDLEAGRIAWFFADGRRAEARAQLIATWTDRDDTFLWGWDHLSAPPGTAIAAAAVKAHADQNAIEELQDAKVPCGFDDGWQLAAVAVLIGDLQGVYRGEAGPGTWAYLGFGEVTISKP